MWSLISGRSFFRIEEAQLAARSHNSAPLTPGSFRLIIQLRFRSGVVGPEKPIFSSQRTRRVHSRPVSAHTTFFARDAFGSATAYPLNEAHFIKTAPHNKTHTHTHIHSARTARIYAKRLTALSHFALAAAHYHRTQFNSLRGFIHCTHHHDARRRRRRRTSFRGVLCSATSLTPPGFFYAAHTYDRPTCTAHHYVCGEYAITYTTPRGCGVASEETTIFTFLLSAQRQRRRR